LTKAKKLIIIISTKQVSFDLFIPYMKYQKTNSTQKKIAVLALSILSLIAIAGVSIQTSSSASTVSEAGNRRTNYIRPVVSRRTVVTNTTTPLNNSTSCTVVGNNQTCINGVVTQN
jgi:hypothetical protein